MKQIGITDREIEDFIFYFLKKNGAIISTVISKKFNISFDKSIRLLKSLEKKGILHKISFNKRIHIFVLP